MTRSDTYVQCNTCGLWVLPPYHKCKRASGPKVSPVVKRNEEHTQDKFTDWHGIAR